MSDFPEEAVEALMRRRIASTFGDQYASPHGWSKFQRERPADTALYRSRAEDDLQAAAPAIEEKARKEERQRVLKELEEMTKRQELNSQDTGWVVPVASIEAFSEFLKDSDG
jgi:hypothetical protein